MESGFVAHAREVEQLLADPRTTFVVVSTLEAAPSHEARFLARELARRELHLGAIVANRTLPSSFTAKASATSARKLERQVDASGADAYGDERSVVAAVASVLDADPKAVRDVLREMAVRFHDLAVVATREAERRAELASLSPLLVAVPVLDHDVNDVGDLLEIAEHLGT